MSFIITLAGLIISVLLLAQLFNESRLQVKQVRRIFGNLVIQAEYDPFTQTESESVIYYPIVSTSITCGRQGSKKRYYIDLPIPTSDTDLKESAVEFVIEPDGKMLKLFIRALDQEEFWVYSKDNKEVDLYMKEIPVKVDENGKYCVDESKLPTPPSRLVYIEEKNGLKKEIKSDRAYYEGRQKIQLSVGDIIVIGGTLFSIRYEGGSDL